MLDRKLHVHGHLSSPSGNPMIVRLTLFRFLCWGAGVESAGEGIQIFPLMVGV